MTRDARLKIKAMSCVPAEEDDYDSEDGYFDDGDYSSYDINKGNMTLNSPDPTTQVENLNIGPMIGNQNENKNNRHKQDNFHNFKVSSLSYFIIYSLASCHSMSRILPQHHTPHTHLHLLCKM